MSKLEIFLLWIFASFALAFFIRYYLPHLRRKITYFVMSKRIKRMSKKYDAETSKKLEQIADDFMQLSKKEFFNDNEN